jgi:hypothetical protein
MILPKHWRGRDTLRHDVFLVALFHAFDAALIVIFVVVVVAENLHALFITGDAVVLVAA